MIKKFIDPIKELDSLERQNILFVGLTFFMVLFSYPILRSTTTSMFLQSFGAKKSPVVWLCSIIGLSIIIAIYNRFQEKHSIHRLFLFTSLFSCVFFVFGAILYKGGIHFWAYPLFVWKEIYIVLLIHMAFGFLTSSISYSSAKILYGPLGAFGSMGGVLGGVLTSWSTKMIDTEEILIMGNIFILISGLLFWKTDHSQSLKEKVNRGEEEHKGSPFQSIVEVKKYVFLIGIVICLSQFAINLANFKFNILFAEIVQSKVEKTRYLGQLYTGVNTTSLIVQLIFVPIALKYFKLKNIHLFIPSFYLVVTFFGLGVGGGSLLPVATAFVIFKGFDYSLFSTSKEMMYFPLSAKQKYGAKYINDIVVYRAAKGVISLFLIYFQNLFLVNILLYLILIIWLISLLPLFSSLPKNEETIS